MKNSRVKKSFEKWSDENRIEEKWVVGIIAQKTDSFKITAANILCEQKNTIN